MMQLLARRKTAHGALQVMVVPGAPVVAAAVRVILEPQLLLLLLHLHTPFLPGQVQKAIVQNIKGCGV